MERVCKECGKTFTTTSSRRQYCYDDHFRTCRICGSSYLVPNSKLSVDNHLCSDACIRIAKGQSSKSRSAKYECKCKICGKLFYSTSPNSWVCYDDHETYCENCGKPMHLSRELLMQGRKTCSDACRYELSNKKFSQNLDRNLSKSRDTVILKYGVDNVMKDPNIMHKAQTTTDLRYGSDARKPGGCIADKIKSTCQSRYGVSYALQSEKIRKQIVETNLRKYGADNPSKSKIVVSKLVTDPSKIDNWEKFYADPELFVQNTFDHVPTFSELGDAVGIRDSSVGQILLNRGLAHLVSSTLSTMEDEVCRYIRTICPDIEIVHNTRRQITPYELDIYLPEYNLAIECNPTATHNSTNCIFSGEDHPKPRSYHKMKTDMCEKAGIFLFHIFGYEWTHKKDIILSMLTNLLHKNSAIIYARQCEIRKVSYSDARTFLDANHRQGSCISSVRLGLYHSDELVSLMTFGRVRPTISRSKDADADSWELIRFCNKLNTSVVGGASRLLKRFIQTSNPKSIISFSDRSHTRGNLYSKLGFTDIRHSDPGYVWVDEKTDAAINRVNAQKSNLIKLLNDTALDLSLSETEIMKSHGYVQVFDSGTITWELVI